MSTPLDRIIQEKESSEFTDQHPETGRPEILLLIAKMNQLIATVQVRPIHTFITIWSLLIASAAVGLLVYDQIRGPRVIPPGATGVVRAQYEEATEKARREFMHTFMRCMIETDPETVKAERERGLRMMDPEKAKKVQDELIKGHFVDDVRKRGLVTTFDLTNATYEVVDNTKGYEWYVTSKKVEKDASGGVREEVVRVWIQLGLAPASEDSDWKPLVVKDWSQKSITR